MPFVNIRIVKEVIASDPEGKKAAIAEKVTSAITQATGLGESDVWVVFEEVAARDWYLGPANVEQRRKAAKAAK
jgi:4-oxalocrotonate tautomerase